MLSHCLSPLFSTLIVDSCSTTVSSVLKVFDLLLRTRYELNQSTTDVEDSG